MEILKILNHPDNPNKRLELKLYDLQILTLLDKFKSMSVDTIYLYVSEYFTSSTNLTRRLNRYIDYGLVEKYRAGSFHKFDYFLTQKGCNFINEVWHKISHERKRSTYVGQQSYHNNLIASVAFKVMKDNGFKYKLRDLQTDRDIKLEHYLAVKKQAFNQKMFMRELSRQRKNMAIPDFKIDDFAFEIELHSKGNKRTVAKMKRLYQKKYITFWIIPRNLVQLREVIEENTHIDNDGNKNNIIVYVDEVNSFNFDLTLYNYHREKQLSLDV